MTTMAGLKKKIEFFGIEEEVIDMIFKENLTYKEICDRLKKDHNIILTEGSISNFKKFVMESTKGFLEDNKEYREELAKKLLDTTELLVFSLLKIRKKIEDFDEPTKWKQQSIYLNLALQEAHLLLKRAGEIQSAKTVIQKQEITNIQINQAIQMELIRWIDEGKIPLEYCAPEIKEFYRKAKAMR